MGTEIHTQFVGKLLTHNGDRSAEARHYRDGEGGADGQAIDEVVESIAQSHHPRHRLDAGHGRPTQPVAHHPPGHLNVPQEEERKTHKCSEPGEKSDSRTRKELKKVPNSRAVPLLKVQLF